MERVRKLIRYECENTRDYKYRDYPIHVAVLDTGISNHPDFGNRIETFTDCVNDRVNAYDDNGHGTHIAGLLGGDGKMSKGMYAGIAPHVRIHSIKILDGKGNGNVTHSLKGINWILENHKKYKIRIANISVGTLPSIHDREEEKLIKAVEQLWDAGIVVVTAAGNYGPDRGTITVPGISKKVITVGASDDQIYQNKLGGMKANYSGRGPTYECVCKPDIIAPGSYIKSCNHKIQRNNKKEYYTVKSGTSMATPVVSGALAMLLSRYEDMSNVEIKLLLKESADNLNRPQNEQGWGLLNIQKLFRYAKN